MVLREPIGVRMLAEVMEPERFGVTDQEAQNAVAGGKRSDPAGEILIYAHGDEVAQRPVTANDPQRSVLGLNKLAGRTDYPVQNRFQAKVFGECYHGVQKTLHPLLDAHGFPRETGKTGQEFVQAGAAGRRCTVRGLPDGFAHRNHLWEM
jgi:hypothetical protein